MDGGSGSTMGKPTRLIARRRWPAIRPTATAVTLVFALLPA